jgi:hypothetical protein
MNGDVIAMLIGVTASLVLATRALRAQRPSRERIAAMAGAWVVIIAVVAYAFGRYAG